MSFRNVIILGLLAAVGCTGNQRTAETISRELASENLNSDSLKSSMRHLDQMTLVGRENYASEVRVELNTWLKDQSLADANYEASPLFEALPFEELKKVDLDNPNQKAFEEWDIDYLYQQRMMQRLADWITDQPYHDSLLAGAVEKKNAELDPKGKKQLLDAVRLFDWTVRNIVLEAEGSADYTQLQASPQLPLDDTAIGFGSMPWETALFSRGDFIERGRLFTCLARQKGISCCWIGIGPEASGAKLFAIGALIGGEIFLFDSKSGMPILDPDSLEFATLADAQSNPRVLRRLTLVGQYDYPLSSPEDLKPLQLLIDVPPTAITARMKLLEESLAGNNRMVVYSDLNEVEKQFKAAAENASVAIWDLPLLGILYADSVRDRLRDTSSSFSTQYMMKNGIWLLDTPISDGRIKHLRGQFKEDDAEPGAFQVYMSSRVPYSTLERLMYDPKVQQELQVEKFPGEPAEQFAMRLNNARAMYGRAKLDASFLLGQLQFDLGDYDSAISWLRDRVLSNEGSVNWYAGSYYTLARAYEQVGDFENAEAALTALDGPQDAGNRLRLRYLRAMQDAKSKESKEDSKEESDS